MKFNLQKFQKFRAPLGLVEQVQIVVSTAVVVAMITIVMVRLLSNYKLGWFDFASVTIVGIFGYFIVYFTLRYGRQLEEQKQELESLNAIAEAVNHAVEINYLLQNALQEVRRVLDVQYAWIYFVENGQLILKAKRSSEESEFNVIPPGSVVNDEAFRWVRSQRIVRHPEMGDGSEGAVWQYGDMLAWASVPVMMKDAFSGIIVLGSKERDAFKEKQLDLMAAFANQIGVALENSALFERLRRSEERYMDLFEHSPDMYHIVNRDGIIISCNQTEADRLGYRKDDLVGHSILKLYPLEHHEEARKLLQRIFERGLEVKGLEEQMMDHRGELIDVNVNTSIIYDENKKPVLMRAVARDITEKKKLEAKILHAQRIDSIGNLAGGISHDFNNILTSILGSTAIMKRKMKKGDPWYRFVDIIETAAKRGAALTRQLLTFARKGTVQFRPVIVNDIVEETLHLFERSIDKTITVKKELREELCLINGDDGQIQQAILNLLINARDAMPEGGLITVSTQRIDFDATPGPPGEDRSGNYVSVAVIDEGIGMDRRTQQHIFEPFFTTKDQGKGTGLGLSVVYGVVNSHDGFITVQSEIGRGSQFTLYFPLLSDASGFKREERSTRLPKGKETVLVVDDEEHVGEVVGGMLANLGYRVTIVSSGQEAIALFQKKKRFDAVVLDMNMPEMGGKETFFKLKELDPDLRVVISTGYTNTSINGSPLESAIDGFLQKPYQLEELSKTMRDVFDRPS